MKLADGARPPTPLPPLTFAPLPFDQAIAAAARRGVVLPADYYGTLQGLARSQAFTVSGLASLAQIQQLRESLDDAIAGGQTFAQWRKRVLSSGVTALPRHRLENIFRTNIQSSYMRGRGEQMLARVATHPYWMYDAVNDSRTRPAHAAMDGTVLRFDNPWWRTHYPPNGYQCFLPGTMVQGLPLLGLKARYSGPAVEIVTAGGRTLRVTANHPVLTSLGWLAAHCVTEGSNLLSASGVVDPLFGVVIDHKQPPARCEDLFEALSCDGLRVGKVSPLDLHGDAVSADCEIHIAGADCLLGIEGEAGGQHRGVERGFVGAHARVDRDSFATRGASEGPPTVYVGLSDDSLHVAGASPEPLGDGATREVRRVVEAADRAFERVILGIARGPGRAELPAHAVGVSLDALPLQELGGAAPANLHTSRNQHSPQASAIAPGFVAELLQACAGSVALDQVVSVRHFHFAGHVYDFQTETGLILAESFVVHNCRCAVRALTQAEAERRGITTAPDPEGQPDEGWNYSVLDDAQAGVRQAVVAAQQTAGPLAPALQQALANPPPIPLGPRVSAAIEPKAGKRLYAKVLGIIDALHGDGVLPRISGTNGRGKKTFGTYWATRSGAAGKIDVSSQGKWPELTLAHEIGHFLDHHGIGTAGVYSSRFEPAIMGDVMRALAASDAIKGLLATTPTKYTRYLLQPHEQWARAYAQWVALRSGDSVLRGQLAATLSEANRQWADADFLPIAAAIDRLFKELKWTR